MNKFLLIIVIFVAPFVSMAQSNIIDSEAETKATIKNEVAIKKVEHININPKAQNIDLNYKKSKDIISIKAYIKSLQLKSKETVMS